MSLSWIDSIAVCYSDLGAAKTLWIRSFNCKETSVPSEWDCTLPSDVAPQLRCHEVPTILLSDWAGVRSAGYARFNNHPILFCQKLSKAPEHLHQVSACSRCRAANRGHGVL